MSELEEIKEINQSGKLIATYIQPHTHSTSPDQKDSRIDIHIPKGPSTWVSSLTGAFLPVGYPDSVTEDYTAYQFFDSVQAFASTIAGLLASRAVLQGLGVGDSTASATGAVLLNILQESAGRIATILFAHRLGSALEPECKKYRLMADIFNDGAMILDCISPAFPKAPRVFLLSASSVCKSLCGVAAGSSKASLSAHFAKQGNLAELNAKDASQETLISLLGMLVGTFVVSRISSQTATWIALITLLSIHLGTNYLAVRSVTMRTLNRQRANLVISNFISDLNAEKKTRIDLPTPKDISHQERIFETDGAIRDIQGIILGYCKIGVSLRKVLSSISSNPTISGSYKEEAPQIISSLFKIYKNQGYIMWYSRRQNTFLVILKENTAPSVQLDAWFHAVWALSVSSSHFSPKFAVGKSLNGRSNQEILKWIEDSLRDSSLCRQNANLYKELRDKGWDLDTAALEVRAGCRLVVERGGE
ncbi:552d3496-06f8-414b-a32a-911fbe0b4266-CDS [Sclerotinia trifoliorum]|uniref:552d3496-06f8-414b-a32a-911fbe0b4266-CDS n=1 Tax=Sclerotinia trifoliorum TaxID=28548 RepID=A0A8H2ZT07_9HELO|nr:552d3496-06f8-414b-a32a-911fbe0b4266-CDS [Sclerotinia trifoliorum]